MAEEVTLVKVGTIVPGYHMCPRCYKACKGITRMNRYKYGFMWLCEPCIGEVEKEIDAKKNHVTEVAGTSGHE